MARQEIKDARVAAKLAALLQDLGASVKTASHDEYKEAAKENRRRRPSADGRDAEAVLKCLFLPAAYTFKQCKRCGETFGTNYRSVAYCSDNCRAKTLAQAGIEWDPTKREEERWGGSAVPREAPSIIPPAAVKALWQMLQPIFSPDEILSPEQLDEILPEPSAQVVESVPTLLLDAQEKKTQPEQNPEQSALLGFGAIPAFDLG